MSDSAPSSRLLEGHNPQKLAALALAVEPETPPAGDDKPWTTLGGIDLHEEIGRGGMGVVYRARQRALDRIVAVKVLLRAQFATREERERFFREAKAAARLQHPGIVAVHEVGEDEGMPWFSMDYIAGRSLERIVREHPMSARSAAECVQKVADAIQHAHKHGVLHRDLKPSNILLDADETPHVTDFGIARIAAGETTTNRHAELTRTGQSLGSPGYAAPEQALHGKADARTDVYGLGALLYHLLTGRPPFQGPTMDAILIQLRENDPLAPRRLNPSVPSDLETICLKSLSKSPEVRYATATAMAEDLGRFLDGKPILARPLSLLGKGGRWARRHPGMAAMLGLIVLLVLGLIGGSLAFARRQQQLERRTALIAQARQHCSDISAESRGQALAALQEAWRVHPADDLKNEFIAALTLHEVTLEPAVHPGHRDYLPPPLGGSADGRFHVRFENGHVVVMQKAAKPDSSLEVARIGPFEKEPGFQMDDCGQHIAIAPQVAPWTPCDVTLHELPSGKVVRTLKHPHGVRCMDWAGHLLATGTDVDRLVNVWDTVEGERLHRLGGHNSDLEAVRFRPHGQELVSLAADGAVHVWHAALGMEVIRLENVGSHGAPAWWSRDGARLFTKRKGSPQVDILHFKWSSVMQTLAPGRQEPRSENLPSLHSSPNALICAAVDETGCRIWDWWQGRLAGFVSKEGAEWMTAELHEETALWTSSWNQPLRRHPLQRTADGWLKLQPHEPSTLGSGPLLAAVRSDGLALASTQNESAEADDRVIVRWPQESREVMLNQPDPYCAALSPDRRWCVTGSFTARHEALLWTLPEGRLHRRLPHKGIVSGLAFVKQGALLWIWGNETLQCLETTTWKPTTIGLKPVVGAFTVSEDGEYAAMLKQHKVALLRLPSLAALAELPVPVVPGHTSLAFSGNGECLFIHTGMGAISRWNIRGTTSELVKLGISSF